MTRKYFGTDGIRGRVGESPITPEMIMKLGHAAGKVLAAHKHNPQEIARPTVIIGKDTRISGYMLESALEAGLCAAGVEVLLVGPMPTPAVAYLTRALRLSAGIMISASHNPYEDNGIKFFSASGAKLPDEIELEIEEELEKPMDAKPSAELGKVRRLDDADGRYIEFCKSTFPNDLDLRGVRLVIDCANGASYHIAPPVFHELGAEVISIANQPNGMNINHECGATQPQTLQAAVKKHRADLGIALDGDGDRLVMVDNDGTLYDGDELLYVIAKHRHASGQFKGGIAGTLMTNLGLELALKRLNIPFGRAKVGDRYVLEMLLERGWHWGGENSGHIVCLDKHTTGDGIISALQVLTALRTSGATLQEYTAELTLLPQILVNVRIGNGFDYKTSEAIAKAVSEAEKELGDSGRVLLRPSGTEPLIRVMVEGKSKDQVEKLAKRIARVVETAALSV
ncbi:MAG: phosphoglucosamine mutase [Pseudomonadota bacterium]